jgi:predicted NAD/FAD-binding protein
MPTRREFLQGAAGLAAVGAAGLPATATAVPRGPGARVAIVGAGAGGIAAAHFLSGDFEVDVFEARPRIGGHCDSRVVEHEGAPVTVDLGAQFFHPDTHPVYVTLLEEIGLYDPEDPDGDDTFEAPGTLCVFPVAGGAPVFSSTHPLATPGRAIGFAVYASLARAAVLDDLDWETTVETWVRGLPVGRAFQDDVLFPWITATIGCSRDDAARASARSILQTFALAFPANLLRGATTYNSRIGLQGNLQRLLDRSPGTRLHLRTAVRALEPTAAGWFVRTAAERRGPYRQVVLNAPPRAGRELLRPLPGFADVVALFDAYAYFDSRLLIHADPAYVHRERRYWAAYNAGVDGRECEGSAWLGALHDRPPSGATVDLFKSWAARRRDEPSQVLLERRFQHPHITPAEIRAARALRPLQGRHGLYFSGQYTTGSDLQETAVWSAMQVAEALAPTSRTLQALKRRLAERGRDGVSYAL